MSVIRILFERKDLTKIKKILRNAAEVLTLTKSHFGSSSTGKRH